MQSPQRPSLPRMPKLGSPERSEGFIQSNFASPGPLLAPCISSRAHTGTEISIVTSPSTTPRRHVHSFSAPGVSVSTVSSLAHFDDFSGSPLPSPAPYTPPLFRPKLTLPLHSPLTPALTASSSSPLATAPPYSLSLPPTPLEGELPERTPFTLDVSTHCQHDDLRCSHNEALSQAYIAYTTFCQDLPEGHTIPVAGLTELQRRFNTPSVSGSCKPTPYQLFEAYRRLDAGLTPSWVQMCKDMGIVRRGKADSPQRTQQYCVRIKRWMREHRVASFFNYLCDSIQDNTWLASAVYRRGLSHVIPLRRPSLRAVGGTSLCGKAADDERDIVQMLLCDGGVARRRSLHSTASPGISTPTSSAGDCSIPPTPLSGCFDITTPSVGTSFASSDIAGSNSLPLVAGIKRSISMTELDAYQESSPIAPLDRELVDCDRHLLHELLRQQMPLAEAERTLRQLARRALLPSAFCAGVGVADVMLSDVSVAAKEGIWTVSWTVGRGGALACMRYEVDHFEGLVPTVAVAPWPSPAQQETNDFFNSLAHSSQQLFMS